MLNKSLRKVRETEEVIRNLQTAEGLFVSILRARDSLRHFLPSSSSEEARHQHKQVMDRVLPLCDDKLLHVRDVLQNSDSYLAIDR